MHELNIAANRLHGEERLIYGDVGHIGIEKRKEFKDCDAEFRIAMKKASAGFLLRQLWASFLI